MIISFVFLWPLQSEKVIKVYLIALVVEWVERFAFHMLQLPYFVAIWDLTNKSCINLVFNIIIGFLDLLNILNDTNINSIGTKLAELQAFYDLAAILDAILKKDHFPWLDCYRFLVCWSVHPIVSKTVEKPFVGIFSGQTISAVV